VGHHGSVRATDAGNDARPRLWAAQRVPVAVLLAGLAMLAGCDPGAGTGVAGLAPLSARPAPAARASVAHRVALPARPAWSAPRAATGTAVPPRLALRNPSIGYIRVAVATVWRSPESPRPVDAPALTAPVAIRRWLAAMTLDQRRDLAGRTDTQALLGDPVLITGLRGGWAEIRVLGQPTPLDNRGYPGWVPLVQLTLRPPQAAHWDAVVVAPTLWLSAPRTGTALAEISFGTRLPLLARAGRWLTVALPDGGSARLPTAGAVVVRPGQPGLADDPTDLVRAARAFRGLPYLWAGTSGFGFDCSGLSYLDYRVHGVRIARDADAQSAGGQPVGAGSLRPGDLLFYASGGLVHHVALYAGRGLLIDSPDTGGSVEVVPLSSAPYAEQYWGARRYPPP